MAIANTGSTTNSTGTATTGAANTNAASSSATNKTGGSTTNIAGKSAIAGNFDQFLTLLTTQLKNQSPLDPLDTNQFTQQLVQFAGVEQQLKTNESLTALLSLDKVTAATNAVNFIGTTITADGATAGLKDGKAEWHVNMPRAGTATVTIKNAAGSVVKTATVSLSAGDQTYAWDGTTSTGTKAAEGAYTISIDAKDTSGAAMTAKTQVTGVVDSVDFSGETPILKVGSVNVPIVNLKSVVRPKG
ncbi:flagellar hook assembly protein FlgD [Bosea sp. Leaf344]|uniref:flagellar hook assembly protein FlgD n=1 Tax=Bosea sp. Leaf344 TaxID=1736346 RepID=UPI0009E77642|nr:flagellar hook assembly protein FlgD [Bosea sp. Leaf344]